MAYGIATSTEVAYFTYIYAKISGEHYRLVCRPGDYGRLAKMCPGYKLDKGLSPSWSISLWHNFASACLHVLDRLQVVIVVVAAAAVVVGDVVVVVAVVVVAVVAVAVVAVAVVAVAVVAVANIEQFFRT